MRPFGAMTAAFLLACAVPVPGHADGPPAAAGAVAQPAAPGCNCPGVQARHASRPYRHARVHARHWRHRWPAPIALSGPPVVYDPPIPSPWDTAYDRAMTLHFRSPEVSGTYSGEPGLPHTPPVRGVQHYRVEAGAAVLQYDGLTGRYIRLAQRDAQRAFPAPAAR
jgi:hypothetical protein